MKRLMILIGLLAACGNNNAANNEEENSLNVFANNFDDCGESDACAEDEECVAYEAGEECAPIAREARLLITDTSTDCATDDPFPGVSLLSIEALKRDGSPLGRGRVVADTPGDPIAADRGFEPDGSPFDGDACDAGFNLGCGGSAVVEIVDDTAEALMLREGQELRLQIRADVDCDGGAADSLFVTACTDPEAVVAGDSSSCSTAWRLENTAPGSFAGALPQWGTK